MKPGRGSLETVFTPVPAGAKLRPHLETPDVDATPAARDRALERAEAKRRRRAARDRGEGQ